ncbi:TetR family transcriptional regulator [Chitinophaga sp. SYP-B3965]|uniref:TetR/AcrR family transcriptional regulator n=1 Tax=Chitinophaga sp. SYP-B3965 TaxID=2663120 RepID=UPI001299F281|nr:TetR/AcrR family transcriptional regulator [Chitinophaga sp. SYP-B3965]MRG44175.1 TetR family transcriptional regulator [Chitinophaga sp. SYP-B3965]
MGITDRKEREKAEMKRLIIEAAMQMFLEEGYEKTSIRNIADKIEYSPGTIYLYYKDKDELLYEVQREAFGRLYEAFVQNAPSKSPWKRLEQISHTYVSFGREHPDLYDLMFIIRAPMNKVEDKGGWENGDACFNYLLECITACIEKKLLRYTDIRLAALSVWSFTHGLVSLNVRCRFKVMDMEQDQINKAMEMALHEYLRLIKA